MDIEPIYIITGYMRTGTSMQMDCHRAGGIVPIYREEREDFRKIHASDTYDPNAGGIYEIGLCDPCRMSQQMARFGVIPRKKCSGFPCMTHFRRVPQDYAGHVVKVLCNKPGALLQDVLPKWKYQVLLMLRDPEEIRQSFEGFFVGSKAPPMVQKQNHHVYHKHFQRVWKNLSAKKLKVQYRHVVEDPLGWFKFMKAVGWPIDAEAAAAVVDSNQCRYRLENLSVGI